MANNMVRFQENMKKLCENPDTSRAGLKWDDSEDENVLSKLKSGMTVDDIAKALKRTANSIKTRIIMNAVKQIDEENKNNRTNDNSIINIFLVFIIPLVFKIYLKKYK